MAETALSEKLGIKAGHRILILNAPHGYLETLGSLPGEVMFEPGADRAFDFVQAFVHNRAEVDIVSANAIKALKPGGLLWFSYPKKSSGVDTDISRDSGWESVRDVGLRPGSQVSVDDTWSALRFRPVEDVRPRPKR
jgi:hypothetical protein